MPFFRNQTAKKKRKTGNALDFFVYPAWAFKMSIIYAAINFNSINIFYCRQIVLKSFFLKMIYLYLNPWLNCI